MKAMRITLFTLCAAMILLCGAGVSAFFVQPPENYYELIVPAVAEMHTVGQEIELTAKLKNKSALISRVTHGQSYIYIDFFSEEQNELSDRVARLAIAITDFFLPFETKTEIAKFTPATAGKYHVEISSSFLIADKDYEYSQIYYFTVS